MASGEAWQSGWNLGSQLAQQRTARKQQLSDEEFQTHFSDLQQDIGNLQTKLSTVKPGTPEYLKTQYALQQAIESRNGLFAQQPGALHKFGHLLHLTKGGGKQPAVAPPVIGQPTMDIGGEKVPTGAAYMIRGPQTPAQLRAQAEAQRKATAAPTYVAPQTPWEKYLANYQEVMGSGAQPSDEQKKEFALTGKITEPKPTGESFKTQTLTLPNGTTLTAQQDIKSGKWQYLTGEQIPNDVLQGAKIAPKELQPKTAWARDKSGKIYSVNLDAKTHQEIPGSRNYSLVPPASLTGRITTGFYHYYDPETGQVIQVPETRMSVPVGAGRPGAAGPSTSAGTSSAAQSAAAAPPAVSTVPKTPGEARSRVPRATAQAPRAGTVPANTAAAPNAPKVGRVIGFKTPKEYSDTKKDYESSIDRMKTMDRNLTNALHNDQQAMLSLVANHIGMTLGGQKGARINQAVWNEAVQSAPWLERAKARFDSRGLLSGVTLAPEQMRQMVQLAHEKVDILKQHLDRLNAEYGRGGDVAGGGMVKMRAPNGMIKQVPMDQVDHYKSLGAAVVK
jgi:hypothetical protein